MYRHSPRPTVVAGCSCICATETNSRAALARRFFPGNLLSVLCGIQCAFILPLHVPILRLASRPSPSLPREFGEGTDLSFQADPFGRESPKSAHDEIDPAVLHVQAPSSLQLSTASY
jgi:hypothetical protein